MFNLLFFFPVSLSQTIMRLKAPGTVPLSVRDANVEDSYLFGNTKSKNYFHRVNYCESGTLKAI